MKKMTQHKRLLLAIALFCSMLFYMGWEAEIGTALPMATFTVNNNGDGNDATPGDGVCETATGNGVCTLRAAIHETNALSGADTIHFESAISVIMPNSTLPSLLDLSGGTTIRGNPTWILGTNAGADANGFRIATDNNKIQGLWITNFGGAGVQVWGDNNIIGTDGDGVDDASEGNLISSNDETGIEISNNATNNSLAGNLIGLTNDGSAGAGNGGIGVWLFQGAHANRIGTNGDGISDDLERNIISGNAHAGISISDPDSDQNVVAGNHIGTNAAGDLAIPNGWSGVRIQNTAESNLVGTNGDGISDALERNLISGNDASGVFIYRAGTDNNVVAGNYIGINVTGDTALPNGDDGVKIESCADNLIGTDGDGTSDIMERNVISGNGDYGVNLDTNSSSSVVAGNYIGTNPAGDTAMPNNVGIVIQDGAYDNRIGTNGDGTADALEGNLISGNSMHGIIITDSGTDSNRLAGNHIGTNAAGTAAIPNDWNGIMILNDTAINWVGTDGDGLSDELERNLISGNGLSGIYLGAGASNVIAGNYIGTDISGNANLGNGDHGINMADGAYDNRVGSINGSAGNRIAFNSVDGIRVDDLCYDNNLRGNLIFANGELGIDLNPEDGVTPNDPGDGDEGGNHLQNYPLLSSARSDSAQIIIAGTLNSSAGTTFTLDFYASSSCDPAGYGEGEIYLGDKTVATDGSGDGSFTVSFPISVTIGYSLTATATAADGNTSEFSPCQGVTALEPPLLTANVDGAGSGEISSTPVGITCPGDCSESYDYGTLVSLTATPNAGSIFNGWSGACIGLGSCDVTMMAPQAVTATFDLLPPGQHALTVNLAGDGEGGVTGPEIDCNDGPKADCTAAFTEGTVVTLTASADAGSIFMGWGGACSGRGDCEFTMTENQTVTATFALDTSNYKIFLPLLAR